jgi:hypothetical protein
LLFYILTSLIPVLILEPSVGGVTGIALSKILEVNEKVKALKTKKMSTVPQLMSNIFPESHIVRGLMGLTMDPE